MTKEEMVNGINTLKKLFKTIHNNYENWFQMILSISLDTFSTQNSKFFGNQLIELEQIDMERSGMSICSISGGARSGG